MQNRLNSRVSCPRLRLQPLERPARLQPLERPVRLQHSSALLFCPHSVGRAGVEVDAVQVADDRCDWSTVLVTPGVSPFAATLAIDFSGLPVSACMLRIQQTNPTYPVSAAGALPALVYCRRHTRGRSTMCTASIHGMQAGCCSTSRGRDGRTLRCPARMHIADHCTLAPGSVYTV